MTVITATDIAPPKQVRRKAGINTDSRGAAKKATLQRTTAPADVADPVPATPPQRTGTKLSAVVALLQRELGASLAELTTETGWLPHTVRATLTGLRKRGMVVTRSKVGDETRYTVEQAAA